MQYYDFTQDMLLRTTDKSDSQLCSYIRFVHIATKTFDSDLYINDNLIVSNLSYREFTDYIKIPPGIYNVKLYPKNTKTKPLIDSTLTITPNIVTTYVMYSEDRRTFLSQATETPLSVPTKKKAKIRVANFIENIPPIDIYLSNGTLLYKNVQFKDITKYIELMPDTYTIDIKLADSSISMLYVPNMNLLDTNYYTLYLIGLVNDFPTPQMLIPLDGISYLKF